MAHNKFNYSAAPDSYTLHQNKLTQKHNAFKNIDYLCKIKSKKP